MSEAFIPFIKCVGTGAKHNRDLTPEEMRQATEMMLSGEASPEQTAAFLLGWRLKPETTEELRVALAVLDRHTRYQPAPQTLELGYPFDGKADNPYLFYAAADFLRPYPIKIVLYGGQLQPSKNGVTVRDVAERLDAHPAILYFDRRAYAPELAALSGIRQRLGLRTAFNVLERLPRAAQSDTALTGVFHKPYVARYIGIFGPRYKRLLIVKGNEGTPEIFGKCRLWLHEGGRTDEMHIDPARYGVRYDKSFRRAARDELIERSLRPDDALTRLARFNAAFWLWAKGLAETLDDGWEMTEHG